MKKNNTLWLLLLALSSLFAACKKDAPQDELSKLPPATQIGANTFGCLVNGKAWIAQTNCRFLCDPSFDIYYDNSHGGFVALTALLQNSDHNEEIDIAFDSANFKREFIYLKGSNFLNIRFLNYKGNTYHTGLDSTVNAICRVLISKYDLQNGIVSGTFNFSLTRPGFETINVTDGRFDAKL